VQLVLVQSWQLNFCSREWKWQNQVSLTPSFIMSHFFAQFLISFLFRNRSCEFCQMGEYTKEEI
jgi:hypothetical protein